MEIGRGGGKIRVSFSMAHWAKTHPYFPLAFSYSIRLLLKWVLKVGFVDTQ